MRALVLVFIALAILQAVEANNSLRVRRLRRAKVSDPNPVCDTFETYCYSTTTTIKGKPAKLKNCAAHKQDKSACESDATNECAFQSNAVKRCTRAFDDAPGILVEYPEGADWADKFYAHLKSAIAEVKRNPIGEELLKEFNPDKSGTKLDAFDTLCSKNSLETCDKNAKLFAKATAVIRNSAAVGEIGSKAQNNIETTTHGGINAIGEKVNKGMNVPLIYMPAPKFGSTDKITLGAGKEIYTDGVVHPDFKAKQPWHFVLFHELGHAYLQATKLTNMFDNQPEEEFVSGLKAAKGFKWAENTYRWAENKAGRAIEYRHQYTGISTSKDDDVTKFYTSFDGKFTAAADAIKSIATVNLNDVSKLSKVA